MSDAMTWGEQCNDMGMPGEQCNDMGMTGEQRNDMGGEAGHHA